MRSAGRAPPLSPSPAWGPGEPLPWVGGVHLDQVMLLHPPHPVPQLSPISPQSRGSLELGRGTLPSSAPSPAADSTMHEFFLLRGTQDPPRAAQGLLQPSWQSSPRGSLGGHPKWGFSSLISSFGPIFPGYTAGRSGGPPPQRPSSLSFFLSLEMQK